MLRKAEEITCMRAWDCSYAENGEAAHFTAKNNYKWTVFIPYFQLYIYICLYNLYYFGYKVRHQIDFTLKKKTYVF